MRTLLLLRHAKSSWDDPALDDHARPLAPRGVRAARRIAAHLTRGHLLPDLVLCSSARRAVQTLDALRPVLGDDAQVHIEDGLYGASQHGLLRLLRTLGPSVSSPIVIGHNPGLEDLALGLAGDGEPAALHQLHAKFPTAALAVFDLQQDAWARLGRGQGYLKEIVLPRDLPD